MDSVLQKLTHALENKIHQTDPSFKLSLVPSSNSTPTNDIDIFSESTIQLKNPLGQTTTFATIQTTKSENSKTILHVVNYSDDIKKRFPLRHTSLMYILSEDSSLSSLTVEHLSYYKKGKGVFNTLFSQEDNYSIHQQTEGDYHKVRVTARYDTVDNLEEVLSTFFQIIPVN